MNTRAGAGPGIRPGHGRSSGRRPTGRSPQGTLACRSATLRPPWSTGERTASKPIIAWIRATPRVTCSSAPPPHNPSAWSASRLDGLGQEAHPLDGRPHRPRILAAAEPGGRQSRLQLPVHAVDEVPRGEAAWVQPGPCRRHHVVCLRLDAYGDRDQLSLGQPAHEPLGRRTDAEADRLRGLQRRLEADLARELRRRSPGAELGRRGAVRSLPHAQPERPEPVAHLAGREPREVAERQEPEPTQQVGQLATLGPTVGDVGKDLHRQPLEERRGRPLADDHAVLDHRLPGRLLGREQVVGDTEPAVPDPGVDQVLGDERGGMRLATEVAPGRGHRHQPRPDRRHPWPQLLDRGQHRLEVAGVPLGIGGEQHELGTSRLRVATPLAAADALDPGSGVAHLDHVVAQDRSRLVGRRSSLVTGLSELEQPGGDGPVGTPGDQDSHGWTIRARRRSCAERWLPRLTATRSARCFSRPQP